MLNCPNKNNDDWKQIVSIVGESKAYEIYSKLNGTIPTIGKTLDGKSSILYNELTKLNGIGESKAKLIIEYRTKNNSLE